jgi:uncharacterized delta-60 repeat protein
MQHGARGAVVGLTAIALIVVGLAGPAEASGPDLDSSFGTCGVKVQPIDFIIPRMTVQQPDGKFIEIHRYEDGVGLVRFRSGGALDTSFGSAGRVTVPIARGVDIADAALAPDGKLLVLILGNDSAIGEKMLRFTAAGALDPSFGIGGTVQLGENQVAKLVVQSDGKPVYIGYQDSQPVIRRLTVDGLLDFYAPQVDPQAVPHAVSLSVDASDHLLVGESKFWGGVSRFDVNGVPDPGFVRRVITFARTAYNYEISAVGSGPGGTVLMAGWVQYLNGTPEYATWFARYLADGSPDPSYGVAGFRLVQTESSSRVIRLGVDGSILVARHTWPGGIGSRARIAIDRYDPNGTRDPAYGRTMLTGFDHNAQVVGLTVRRNVIIMTLSDAIPNDHDTLVLVKLHTDPVKRGAGLVLDDSGALHPIRFGTDPGPPCVFDGPTWTWNAARGVATVAGKGGYVVDAYGRIRSFSLGSRPRPPAATGSPRWQTDFARDITSAPDGLSGYVLDAFGGLHTWQTSPGAVPPPPAGPYWPGWDIARGVAMLPNGNGGYVLDGFGGLHPFRIGAHSVPAVHGGPYWPGWDIARAVAILPDGTGGYVLDGSGGVHPFGIGTHGAPPKPGPGSPYFAGQDRAQGIAFVAG